jgi:hypothetical protein
MYQPFFERDITHLGSKQLENLEIERDSVQSEISEIDYLLKQENDFEENQKDYILIQELEKTLSDLKIRLNTINSQIEELDDSL